MSGFDTSEMRSLGASFPRGAASKAPRVQAVVFKTAMKIKEALQAEARTSVHFGRVAEAITFDMTADRSGFGAEIGPEVGRGQGSLAHIAYFGGSRGGGNTLADPQEALDEESPKFERAIADLYGDVL